MDTFLQPLGVSQGDPAAATPPRPGSFRLGVKLMQDAVQAVGVSVGGGSGGGNRNQEALFANPFKETREEALVINGSNILTYLERTDSSDTGWRQQAVGDATGTFSEVVVAVHPDGGVWAFAVPAAVGTNPPGPVQIFQLGIQTDRPDGTTECVWTAQPTALPAPWHAESLCVSYAPDAGPMVAGVDRTGQSGFQLTVLSAQFAAAGQGQASPWAQTLETAGTPGSGTLVGAGFLPYSATLHKVQAYVFYLQNGTVLTRLVPGTAPMVVSRSVKHFCGTWNVPNTPQTAPQGDIGFMYLDAGNGDLVTGYCSTSLGYPFTMRDSALGFETATVWQDADGKLHVFGEDIDGTLQVLHQAGWNTWYVGGQTDRPMVPRWTRATPKDTVPGGIGGCDLEHPEDQVLAFDFDGTGKQDHLVVYRPLDGEPSSVRVLAKQRDGSFAAVFDNAEDPFGCQIGTGDLMFALDYKSNGKQDHLVVYRPGAGRIVIVRHAVAGNGTHRFEPVFEANSIGIGEFDLSHPEDRLFAFDFDGGGSADHIVAYRPGAGLVMILRRLSGRNDYGAVYKSGVHGAGSGIGGYDMAVAADRMFAFDYSGSGSASSLVAYRPGQGSVFIIQRQGDGSFGALLHGSGIAGYPMTDPGDRLMPYYFDGAAGHLIAYRVPTTPAEPVGVIWMLANGSGPNVVPQYTPVFTSGDPRPTPNGVSGTGIGGYDLASGADRITAFDYGDGRPDHLLLYRPGTGKVAVVEREGDLFLPVYTAPTVPVPVTIGLQRDIIDFRLDAYPSYRPAQIVKLSGVAAPEAYLLSTQDVTTAAWATDKVRLEADASQMPEVISRYVATASLLDTGGALMPGHNITVSADSLVEVRIDQISYQVGPGRPVSVAIGGTGTVVISVAAKGLSVPTVYLNADGLASGVAVDLAAAVNGYLAGKGTLPSQNGTFTAPALESARCTNADGSTSPLVADWLTAPATPAAVVGHCSRMYAMAAGDTPLLTAVIEGHDEPQPIVGYVIQKWDPTRPSYQVFRTHADLAEYQDYRDNHPAYGGVWEDFARWASDAWEGVREGVVKVAEIIVHTAVEIAVWIGDAVVSLGQMIVTALDQAVQAVEAVFQMIADAVVRVIDWLKALFNFKDIWDTSLALESMTMTVLGYAAPTIRHFGGISHDWLLKLEGTVGGFFEQLKRTVGGTSVGDLRHRVPVVADSSGYQVDPTGFAHDPQVGWMFQQMAHSGAKDPALWDRHFGQSAGDDNILTDILAGFDGAGLFDLFDSIGHLVTDLFSFDSDDAIGPRLLVDLLDVAETFILALLKIADKILQAITELLADGVTAGLAMLNAPLSLGFINTIYDWFQDNANVDPAKRRPMTTIGLMSLVLGFITTTTFKLANGVDNAPFPGGAAPHLPAPPWLQGLGHAVGVGNADDPAAHAKSMLILQQVCYGIGFFSAFTGCVSDFSGGQEGDTPKPIVIFNALALVFTLLILSVPPVTGTPFGTVPLWDGIFGVSTGYTLLEVIAAFVSTSGLKNIPVYQRDEKDKNGVKIPMPGTICSAVFGTVLLGCTSAVLASTKPRPDPVYWTADLLAPMPMIFELARLAPTAKPVVAGVNAAVNIASCAAGFTAAGFCQAYRIDPASMTSLTAQVGMNFAHVIHSDNNYFKPGTAAVSDGKPPSWLLLGTDGTDATLGGIPDVLDTVDFTAWAYNSGWPAWYSNKAPVHITVTPTPVGGMDLQKPAPPAGSVGTTDTVPMAVLVTGTDGRPLKGAGVVFTLPASGASGTFGKDGPTTFAAVSDEKGIATALLLWRNSTIGTFSVTAVIPGTARKVPFPQQNLPTPVVDVAPIPGASLQSAPGMGLLDGSVQVGSDFPNPVAVLVTGPNGAPVPNVIVVFTAPPADQDKNFYGQFKATGQTDATAVSDSNGVASAGVFTAVSAVLTGRFNIVAQVQGNGPTTTLVLTTVPNTSAP